MDFPSTHFYERNKPSKGRLLKMFQELMIVYKVNSYKISRKSIQTFLGNVLKLSHS